MSSVFDGQTKQLLHSVHTPRVIHDPGRYAVNPRMPQNVPVERLRVEPGTIRFKGEHLTTGVVHVNDENGNPVCDLCHRNRVSATMLHPDGDLCLCEACFALEIEGYG